MRTRDGCHYDGTRERAQRRCRADAATPCAPPRAACGCGRTRAACRRAHTSARAGGEVVGGSRWAIPCHLNFHPVRRWHRLCRHHLAGCACEWRESTQQAWRTQAGAIWVVEDAQRYARGEEVVWCASMLRAVYARPSSTMRERERADDDGHAIEGSYPMCGVTWIRCRRR